MTNKIEFTDSAKKEIERIILEKGKKTLLFAIYNANNQRTYLTVKLK